MEHLTDRTFDAFVGEGMRIVAVVEPSTELSRRFRVVLDDLARWLSPEVRVGLVDADQERALAARLTDRLPTLFGYQEGQWVKRFAGLWELAPILRLLQASGFPFRAEPAASTDPYPLPMLEAFYARVRAADLSAEALGEQIQAHAAAASVPGFPMQALIDVAQARLYRLPELVAELREVVQGSSHALFRRVGVLGALIYAASPEDGVSDDAPGGYGLLDDVLLLEAARWLYLRDAPALPDELLRDAFWQVLPRAALDTLMPFVAAMPRERDALRAAPDATLLPLLLQLVQQPVPTRFPLPWAAPVVAPPMGAPAFGGPVGVTPTGTWAPCGYCNGQGKVQCPGCQGRGMRTTVTSDGPIDNTCLVCGGNRRVRCDPCMGAGRVPA